MAGFGPVGSFPVASIPTTATGSTFYAPITATIIFGSVGGDGAPVVTGINPIVVYQTVRETLRSTTADIEVRALVRETLRSSTFGDTAIDVRAIVRETLRSSTFGDTGVDVRSLVREVLRSSGLKAGRRRQLILPNVGPWQ